MIASTTAGKVNGLEKGGVLQFRGIRYARAERFAPPQPVEASGDVIDATRFGAMAPQNPSPLESMLGAGQSPQAEDCLFLNVFTPALDDGDRPVLVWIHGGGFTAGSGSIPWYDGSKLVERGDVVVVSINYRLGALGFMAVDGFPGSGSNGLADQIAALEWVRDNITSFGGDPAKVTIFGESAGGMSVSSLLGAPRAAGLFRAAIPQSGAAEFTHTPDSAAALTALMLQQLGGTDAGAFLEADVATLLAAQQAVGEARRDGSRLLPFMPCVDGTVLSQTPLDAIRAGSAAGVAVLNGTTSEEWNLFHIMERIGGGLDDDHLHRRVSRVIGDAAADLIALYRSNRPGASADDIWCAIGTDWVFRMPSVRLLEAQAAHRPHDTFAYELTYRSTAFDGHLGAAHAIDVPFVFDNLHRKGVDFMLGGVDDETRALGIAMSTSWLGVAREGSPAHPGVPAWRPYGSGDRAVMAFGRTTELTVDPRPDERKAWEGITAQP